MKWRKIDKTTPTLERVIVCGWQPSDGITEGYWWFSEDAIFDGEAIEKPDALYWCRFVLPKFPEPPEQD